MVAPRCTHWVCPLGTPLGHTPWAHPLGPPTPDHTLLAHPWVCTRGPCFTCQIHCSCLEITTHPPPPSTFFNKLYLLSTKKEFPHENIISFSAHFPLRAKPASASLVVQGLGVSMCHEWHQISCKNRLLLQAFNCCWLGAGLDQTPAWCSCFAPGLLFHFLCWNTSFVHLALASLCKTSTPC